MIINPKHEARNSKQIQNSNFQNPKQKQTSILSRFSRVSRAGFVCGTTFSYQFVMRALPSPGDNENLCCQETAHQLPVFFIINPLVYLGALVPWWLFS